MSRVAVLVLVLSHFAACQQTVESQGRHQRALVGSETAPPPTDAGTVARARELHPAVATGRTEHLLVWADSRNAPFRRFDLYGARLAFDGGLLDPLGFPVVTSPLSDIRPSVGFTGDGWVLGWVEDNRPTGYRLLRRTLAANGALGEVVEVANGFIPVITVASGPRSALMLWRIPGPKRAMAQVVFADGGAGPVRELGASDTPFEEIDFDAVWTGSSWFVVYANGSTVVTAEAFEDGGSSAPVVVSGGHATLYHLSTAVSPTGARAVAWRANNNQQPVGQVFAMVLPPGPVIAGDAGFRLTTGDELVSGVDVGWTDAGFLVAWARQASGAPRLYASVLPESGAPDSGIIADAGLTGEFGPRSSVVVLENSVISVVGQEQQAEDLRRRTLDLSGPPSVVADRPLVFSAVPRSYSSVAAGVNEQLLLVWREVAANGRFEIWGAVYEQGALASGSPKRLQGDVIGQPWPQATWGGASWWVAWHDNTRNVLRQFSTDLTEQGRDEPVINLVGVPPERGPAVAGTPMGVVFGAVNGASVQPSVVTRLDAGVSPFPLMVGYAPRVAAVDGGLLLAAAGGPSTLGDPRVRSESATFAQVCDTRNVTTLDLASNGTQTLVAYARGATIQGAWARLEDGGVVVDFLPGCGFTIASCESGLPSLRVAAVDSRFLVMWTERADGGPGLVRGVLVRADGGTEPALVPSFLGPDTWAVSLATLPGQSQVAVTATSLDLPGLQAPQTRLTVLTVGRSRGDACAAASECESGFCADGVCCNEACGGTTPDCRVCSVAAGGTATGSCTNAMTGTVCRPVASECDVSETCTGLPTCQADRFRDGGSCASGAGVCSSPNFCAVDAGVMDAGVPDGGGGDAGVDAGVMDAGVPDGGGADAGVDAGLMMDAGGPDGGEADAGVDAGMMMDASVLDAGGADAGPLVDAGGVSDAGQNAPDAGDTVDSGLPDGGPPDGSVSHYDWNRGCGCGATDGVSVLALALVLLRRRSARVLGVVTCLVGALALGDEAPRKRTRLVFLGLSAGPGLKPDEVKAMGDFVQSRVARGGGYDITSPDDLAVSLGLERQRQLLGCGDSASACTAELAGALAADRILSGSLSRVGESLLLSMTLLDGSGSRLQQVSSRLKGGTLDGALDEVDVLVEQLLAADPLRAGESLTPQKRAPAVQWSAGVRVEAEVLGLAAGGAAVAPSLTLGLDTGWFGAAATGIINVVPGARLEARLHPPLWVVRPYLGAGATLFGTAFAPRGSLGAFGAVGPVQLSFDAAVEYFVTGPARFRPLAVLVSLGAAWLF